MNSVQIYVGLQSGRKAAVSNELTMTTTHDKRDNHNPTMLVSIHHKELEVIIMHIDSAAFKVVWEPWERRFHCFRNFCLRFYCSPCNGTLKTHAFQENSSSEFPLLTQT